MTHDVEPDALGPRDGGVHEPRPLERMPSGIRGFDALINGGFFRGGLYLVLGPPGSGKTVFGNQVAFAQARAARAQGRTPGSGAAPGGAVYFTLLAESHGRMLAHLRGFTFFDPAHIADAIYYVSGYRVLEKDGLRGLLDLIQRVLRERRASVLVIDGLSTAEATATNDVTFKKFLYELHTFIEVIGATAFLLAEGSAVSEEVELALADGLIELSDERAGLLTVRELEVRKFRGSAVVRGRHVFEIGRDGIVVHQRVETLLGVPEEAAGGAREREAGAEGGAVPAPSALRLATGVARLDEMLHGGVLGGTTTLVFGPPGSGKTLLGLHFLAAGAARGERGLHFGFLEAPERVAALGDGVGLDTSGLVARGAVRIIRRSPFAAGVDAIASELAAEVRRTGARRVLIDGLRGLEQAAIHAERTTAVVAAVTAELARLGATTFLTADTREVLGRVVRTPAQGAATIVDNIIYLRYVELRSQMYRLLSIFKMRGSAYEASVRELTITGCGMEVAATNETAEAILAGIATPAPPRAHPGGERERRP